MLGGAGVEVVVRRVARTAPGDDRVFQSLGPGMIVCFKALGHLVDNERSVCEVWWENKAAVWRAYLRIFATNLVQHTSSKRNISDIFTYVGCFFVAGGSRNLVFGPPGRSQGGLGGVRATHGGAREQSCAPTGEIC